MQIVAPAGSFSALKAAVGQGADAVYLGMTQFGARAKAQNFEESALREAIEYAHFFGTKVFVTLNTLIKDTEMNKAVDMAKFAYSCGVDAAIVQDIRFIEKLKRALPDLVLHASTQMGVHNALGARALADLGIRRAVLARETLPSDIAEIKKTGIEIEFFVQGALCVCFSGNCYFSSLASSYSGNRGKCMQLCRKQYELDGKKGYFLSAKDLCLYEKLGELEKLGVDAIKIEGRMRSDAYVAQAVRTYKSDMPVKIAVNGLKAVFNRGNYCSAYLDDGAEFNVIYDKTQSNIGVFVGKIDRIRGNAVSVRGFVPHRGDGFKITRDGVEVGGAEEKNGEIVCNCKCKIGDSLNRTSDGELTRTLEATERKIPVDIEVYLSSGEYPRVCLSARSEKIETIGDSAAQQAVTRALTEDDISRAFRKTAEYMFAPNITVITDGTAFMPVSALNELRRKAYDELYTRIVDSYVVKRSADEFKGLKYNRFEGCGVILQTESLDRLDEDILSRVDYVALNPRDYSQVRFAPKIDKPILLNMPVAMRGADRQILEAAVSSDFIYGAISNNLYTLKLTDKPILLGYGHNIIGACDLPHIRSFESDLDDSGANNVWQYAYGHAPMMTLCHCPYGKCKNCSGDDVLTDEQGRKFPMRRYNVAHCYWQLLNNAPHNMSVNSKIARKNKFYDCTTLDTEEIRAVLDGRFDARYTRGNVNRGLK